MGRAAFWICVADCGEIHSGFGGVYCGPDSNWDASYWRKVRKLCVELVRAKPPLLKDEECLSVCGHVNLGLKPQGAASEECLDAEVLAWLPGLLMDRLRPQILVCFGWNHFMRTPLIGQSWGRDIAFSKLLGRPSMERQFGYCPRYRFRVWRLEAGNGRKLTVVFWPNHASRPPFGGTEDSPAWRQAIEECEHLLEEELSLGPNT